MVTFPRAQEDEQATARIRGLRLDVIDTGDRRVFHP